MENPNNQKKPLLLKLTAIGTFIYLGFMFILNFIPYLPESYVDFLFTYSKPSREVVTMLIFGGTGFVICSSILTVISIVSVYFMMKLSKKAYFTFVIAQLVLMFMPFLFISILKNLFGPGFIFFKMLPNLTFTIILILLYSVHYKKFS